MKKDAIKYLAYPLGAILTFVLIKFMQFIDLVRIPADAWSTNILGFIFYAFFISLAIHKYLQKGGSLYKVGVVFLVLLIVVFNIGYFTSHLLDNPLLILLMIVFWLMLFYFITPEFFKNYSKVIVGLFSVSALFFLYVRLFTSSIEQYFNTYKVWALSLILLPIPILVSLWLYEQWKWFRTLRLEKSEAELALLRSQINPHFFFNTLNNLYSLVVQKSDDAPGVIVKLADMMRYTIYEGEKEKVSLQDEIEYLRLYIDLHAIRYNKKVDIRFETPESSTVLVAPLLYIVLLENAFKHGVESLREDAFIHASILVINGKVQFKISNNYEDQVHTEGNGIGLHNLRKRLELLYPNKHSLEILAVNAVFTVTLHLDIV